MFEMNSTQPPVPENRGSGDRGKSLLEFLWDLRNFTIFWLGQSLSEIGTALTGFGLGIWVYQNTHAVTQLSLVFLATTLPGVLLTPFVGALVDRWNRRWIIFFSDCGAALITFVLLLLLMGNHLQVWHTYISAFLTSLCGSFQMLTKGASIPMLVDKQELGRVNGLLQFSTAVSRISAPAIAGFLIAKVDIEGLLCIDLSSYAIGLLTLLFVSIPQPESEPNLSEPAQKPSLVREILDGWHVIQSKSVFIIVILFMSLHFFIDGMTNVLINPLILSFSTPQIYGNVMSVAGCGMVAGSIFMSVVGGRRNILSSLSIASAINGLGLMIAGFQASITVITCGVMLSFFTIPIILGSNQVIWQSHVQPNFQGRVLSLVGTLTGLGVALGNISASPLADLVLEPMFLNDGLLAHNIGQFTGTGHGRGIGFLIMLEGLLILLVSFSFYVYITWQNLEEGLLMDEGPILASDLEES